MKNGDVYRAEILKEDFGNYVQVLLKDGDEKRLVWGDVESIDHVKEALPDPTPIQNPHLSHGETVPIEHEAASNDEEYPTQSLNPHHLGRFDFDLVGVSYDTTWQKISMQLGAASFNGNATNRYLRTAPVEFLLGAYFDRWHLYLDYMNAPTNSNDVSDGAFSTIAPTFAVMKNLDLGLMFGFSYSSSSSNSSSNQLSGSDYMVGPFFRAVAPIAESAAIEVSGGAGVDFREATISNSGNQLSGSDTAFYAKFKIEASVSLFKQVSYVAWADGWVDLGILNGTVTSGTTVVTGSLQDNVYRMRLVPFGIRLKF